MDSKRLKAEVDGFDDKLVFLLDDKDGWWVNDKYGLVINPKKTVCHKYPWHGDGWCEAPTYRFKVCDLIEN